MGSLSPASALSETALFTVQKAGPYASAGTLIGTAINNLIDEYDPSLGDAIGGTINGTINAAQQAATEVEKGHYQSAYDDLFGFPVTNSHEGDGDWDVADPMIEYYGDGGGCGCGCGW